MRPWRKFNKVCAAILRPRGGEGRERKGQIAETNRCHKYGMSAAAAKALWSSRSGTGPSKKTQDNTLAALTHVQGDAKPFPTLGRAGWPSQLAVKPDRGPNYGGPPDS